MNNTERKAWLKKLRELEPDDGVYAIPRQEKPKPEEGAKIPKQRITKVTVQ